MLRHFFVRPSMLAGFVSAIAMATPCALAQDAADAGAVSQQGAVELTYDHADSGQDVVAATIEYGLAVRFGEGWTVQMDAVFEPVEDAVGDAAFESQDAYVETLSVQYAGETFSVYAGKINPMFGSAADLAPGLYGVEVGEAYQLTEQLGIGGDVALHAFLGLEGEHVLSGAVFRADRSVLSQSVGGLRERVRLSDGGLTNTDGFKSVAISLDGALSNGFGYSLGHRRLASETVGESDESMTVAGVSYALPEDFGIEASFMGEVGASRNADGIAGANRDFYTAGATVSLGDWFVNAIASGWNENAAAGDVDLRKLEISVGREIFDGVILEFGAQDARTDGGSDTVIGARLAWAFG